MSTDVVTAALTGDIFEFEVDEFEIQTPRVINQFIKDLDSDKDWIRIKAQELILSRTRPARDVRTFKFDMGKLNTLQDVARAARDIFFITSRGIINTKECKAWMELLHSIKEIIIDAEFGDSFEDLKSFAEKHPDWPEYIKNRHK